MKLVDDWEALGSRMRVAGRDIFVIDRPAAREAAPPALILHGFPSCSFDWRHVLDRLAERRRVVLLDFLGYGLSEKPLDHSYSLFEQADIVDSLIADLGLDAFALVTHDMGDSVGGEVLARAGHGIERRVVTNGSIYMDLVQLSAGQQLLLDLPDETLPADQAPGADLLKPGLAATFATPPDDDELDAQWELVARGGGNRLLARLIRYIGERREHEHRWTGAIESHPAPLTIIWGDRDPIAVFAMAERLSERTGAPLVRLEGIGHYPMIEAPGAFADALVGALDSG